MSRQIFHVERGEAGQLVEEGELPPVVARMVVEIRSDGSRTVARGALEDLASGQSVAIRAEAPSPASLALELGKSLLRLPVLAEKTMLSLLPARLRRR